MSDLYRAAIAGGLLGTLVMTTMLRAASELGITRMDLPFLLGTAVTDNRRRARIYGYLAHFGAGTRVRSRLRVRLRCNRVVRDGRSAG